MTASEPIGPACREIVQIDALMRALRSLRHWSATAATRNPTGSDLGRRLFATAGRLREEAWADSLRAAYDLFEIDAIHQAWIEAGGRDA